MRSAQPTLIGQTARSPPGRNNEKPWPHNPARVVTHRIPARSPPSNRGSPPPGGDQPDVRRTFHQDQRPARSDRESRGGHRSLRADHRHTPRAACRYASPACRRAQATSRVARRLRPQAYETSASRDRPSGATKRPDQTIAARVVTMGVEQLTYAEIASRLGVTSEAARAIVKRHRLPRSPGNDGKVLVSIDLADLRHRPLPARSPRRHQPCPTRSQYCRRRSKPWRRSSPPSSSVREVTGLTSNESAPEVTGSCPACWPRPLT